MTDGKHSLHDYGYEPGDYFAYCHICRFEFPGDKRAITCPECAEKLKAKTRYLKRKESHHHTDSMLMTTAKSLCDLLFQGFTTRTKTGLEWDVPETGQAVEAVRAALRIQKKKEEKQDKPTSNL